MKKTKNKEKKFLRKEPVKRIATRWDKGLSNYEANLREYQGAVNKTSVKVNRSYLDIFIKNFCTFFNFLLIAIGIILLAAQRWDSCAFLIILALNVTIGITQDVRAKRMVDRLTLTTKADVKVIREGKERIIEPEKICLDDVMILSNDQAIPCDGIILQGHAALNESLLTGESVAAKKEVGDVVYSGTYITSGQVYVRVDKVGDDCYIQQLQAKSKEFKRINSKVFTELNYLFKIIAGIVIAIGVLMFIQYGFIKNSFASWQSFVGSVGMMAGSIVSMIPSGMYLLASTTLAVGTINLSKKGVLVRDLYSVEGLARVDTLCIDKTGTITDGTMSVHKSLLLSTSPFKKDRFEAIMSSYIRATEDSNYTAEALKEYFNSKEIFPSKSTIPFDSANKYSAATLQDIGTIVVGACGFFKIDHEKEIQKKVDKFSTEGYRVLVVGYSEKSIRAGKIPSKLTPIALILINDHIRDGVVETLKWFSDNGVLIKVISGDNPITVSKIAETVGVPHASKYISLEGLSDEEVAAAVEHYNVFGRVTPEQKEIIAKTLRKNDHTIAMFGDGVNDILAMKSSDVSISVASGSRATRDIASLVLLNNDFNSLPDIVAQGRRVINNLQRTCSLFLTKTIFSISLNIFFIVFGFLGYASNKEVLWPFTPQHFYAWEMISIGISAFLLALEPNKERLNGHFLRNIFKKSIPNGLMISVVIMIVYILEFIYGNNNPSNVKDLTFISVYFFTIASLLVLAETSYKFNWYRITIMIGAVICTTLLFAAPVLIGVNFLGISNKLTNFDYFYALLVMLGIFIVYMAIVTLVKFVIKKYKERKARRIFNA